MLDWAGSAPWIAHIMLDEKFTEMAIRQFEDACPRESRYIVVGGRGPILGRPAEYLSIGEACEVVKDPNIRAVIFHSLPSHFYTVLKRVPENKPIVWIGWGYDFYDFIYASAGTHFILPLTRTLNEDDRCPKLDYSKLALLKKILFFAPVVPSEYDLLAHSLGLNFKYVEWNYGTVEKDLNLGYKCSMDGVRVLLGNSATPSNNHLDAFELIVPHLSQVDQICCPLSYGSLDYRERIICKAKYYFGSKYSSLLDFMDIDIYWKWSSNFNYVIMNHVRQQGVANICSSMLSGAKVYLREENPITRWIREMGGYINSVENLDFHPLAPEEMTLNAQVVEKHWSREAQRRRTKNMVALLNNHL